VLAVRYELKLYVYFRLMSFECVVGITAGYPVSYKLTASPPPQISILQRHDVWSCDGISPDFRNPIVLVLGGVLASRSDDFFTSVIIGFY